MMLQQPPRRGATRQHQPMFQPGMRLGACCVVTGHSERLSDYIVNLVWHPIFDGKRKNGAHPVIGPVDIVARLPMSTAVCHVSQNARPRLFTHIRQRPSSRIFEIGYKLATFQPVSGESSAMFKKQKRPRNSRRGLALRSGGHGARTRNPITGAPHFQCGR
jgi:hypothetical protein